jgi:hypothetical protein
MHDRDSPQIRLGLGSEKKSWDPPKASVVPIKLEERLLACNLNIAQCAPRWPS